MSAPEPTPPVVSAQALVELARPGNVVMAVVGVAIGAIVVTGDPLTGAVGLAAVATALVTAGGNALNDVVDRAIDRTGHPQRPIPSGRLSYHAALVFAVLAFAIALVAGWLVGRDLFLLVIGAEAVLLVYETYLKASGLAGNLVVALLVAMTFVAGAMAAKRPTAPVGFLAGLSFLANVGREAYKDAQDVAHDEGRRTIAHRWGQRGARRFAGAVTLLGVALSPVPFFIGFGGWPYLAAVLVADLVFVGAVLVPQPGRAQRLSKVAMVLALVAFALGGIL